MASPSEAPECRLTELKSRGPEKARTGAVFWPSAWRTKLCSCANCKVRCPDSFPGTKPFETSSQPSARKELAF